MDRRLFLTGLLGVAGSAALVTAMPREAQALATGPLDDATPGGTLFDELKSGAIEDGSEPEGVEVAYHHGRRHHRRWRRRRRRRVRRWRRRCRRHRNRWGHWRRRCRRVPFWAWIWF
jgi:hypothetical protein